MSNDLKDLGTEIKSMVSSLKKEGKAHLAREIEANWDKTLFEYSRQINSYQTKRPMEKILKEALATEFARLKYSKNESTHIIAYLEKHRILQTTSHTSPTNIPRFFFIDWLHSLSLSEYDYFPVAMFSGVPFSNWTRPGRLRKSDGDINLVPSSMQDALVYGSKINERIVENISKLDPEIKKILPKAKAGDSYTAWALKTSQKIEGSFLHGKPVFFDFNEVVKNYLLQAFENPNHPLSLLLLSPENLKKLEIVFKDEVFFYLPTHNTKYETLDSYYLKSGALQSSKNKILLTKENLIKELKEHRLCVGLPLGFLIYSFLNDFLCVGSFAQIEYLPKYKKKFSEIPVLNKIIRPSPTGALAVGGFKESLSQTPLDMYLEKKTISKAYETSRFGEALVAIKDVLLNKNYSSKYEKSKTKLKKNNKTKVHFIGICGKGMSGLAIMLKQKGFKITGSDEGIYEPVISMLRKNKIPFYTSHKKENIPEDADFIIIGKHATLTPETNVEVKAAFASGITIKSMPEAIGDLIKDKENTVVVGSFGKSTMTGLVAFALGAGKRDPSYFIGAVPLGFKQNARLGKGKEFILEGDEYPSANWDHNSKFLYMRPTNSIFISGEHDHVNVFPTERDYIKPYEKFMTLLPKNGLLVACRSAKNVAKISRLSRARVIYYGIHEYTSYHAKNIIYGTITSFDLYKGKKKIVNLETTLLGLHNIENIIGASAFLLEKKLLTTNVLQKAIKNFKGLSGRLDLKTKKSSVLVYEGYGSSYAKAKSVFDAIKLHYPSKRLVTVFEPHTFSWRNESAKIWYKDVFSTSDIVLVLPPPTTGADTHKQLSYEDIVHTIREYNDHVYEIKNEEEGVNVLKKILKRDDLVALVSSGSLFGLSMSIPKLVESIFPKN